MPDKRVFLDSNVILYAYSDDERKKTIAKTLLKESPCISVQVINEVINVSTRKFGLSRQEIREVFELLRHRCQVTLLECSTIEQALLISETYQYSYFDSLILSSALEHDCQIVYSEDLQHNQRIKQTLTIKNPFVS